MTAEQCFQSGVTAFDKQDFNLALKQFDQAISLSENAKYYAERGITYYYLKQKTKALSDFDKAANLEPNNPYRYASRAYIKDGLNDIEGAISDYQKAIELDPQDAVSHNNLGLLQEKQGYMKRAEGHYKKADELSDLLNDHQIDLPEEKEETKTPPAPHLKNYLKEATKVFTDKNQFKAFLQFIKNGFKQ